MSAALGDHPFFSTFDRDELGALEGAFRPITARAGETIWSEGDDSTFALIIVKGKIELLKGTSFGGKRFVVGLFSDGSIIGEEALSLEGYKRPVSAVCTKDSSLLEIEREDMISLGATHPAAYARLLAHLLELSTRRLSQSYDRLTSIF